MRAKDVLEGAGTVGLLFTAGLLCGQGNPIAGVVVGVLTLVLVASK